MPSSRRHAEAGDHAPQAQRPGRIPDPEDVWRQFENLLADGHRPTVKTYTSLLSALGDVGAPEDAEEVLARMRDAGEAPDARAYNAAVHAWCANGKPANAERLVEKSGDGVGPSRSPHLPGHRGRVRSRRPATVRVHRVSHRERVRGRGRGAAMVREGVPRAHPRVLRSGSGTTPKEVQRWNYEQLDMERVAERKGRVSRPVTASYGMIIDHYAPSARWGTRAGSSGRCSGIRWRRPSRSSTCSSRATSSLATWAPRRTSSASSRDPARGTWTRSGSNPTSRPYTSLMDHWANQGVYVPREKILAKMELKGVAPDERTFGSLVKAYARGRNPEGAEKVLERMRRYDAPDPGTRTGAGRGGRKEPDWRRKGKRAKDGKDGERRKKLSPGVIAYSTVVSAYAAVGDMANARRVVAEMSDRRVRPNDRTRAHLAWGYGQLGDVAGVTQTAQLMVDEGVSMRPGFRGGRRWSAPFARRGLPASHVDRRRRFPRAATKGGFPRASGGGGGRVGRGGSRRRREPVGAGLGQQASQGGTAPTRRQRRRRRRRRRRRLHLRSTTPSRRPRRRSRGGRAGTATVAVVGR